MDIRVLNYFLAVVQERSISKAAKYLHITQPTLSRQIMDLEDELGVKLFIRGAKQVDLTEEGFLLKKRAEEITDLVNKTKEDFTNNDIISGEVFIGGGETYAVSRIAKIIKDIQNDYSDIVFNFYSGNADDVIDKLDKGLIDFGVVIEPVNIEKYESIKLPDKDTWGILMRKDSELAKNNKSLSFEDLKELPLIISRQALIKNEMNKFIGIDYNELNIVATYNLIYNTSLLVRENVGYALCLDKLVNTSASSDLHFIPLVSTKKASLYEANLFIIWKKNQIFSKASNLFLSKVKEVFENN